MTPKQLKIILPLAILAVAIVLMMLLKQGRQPAEQREDLPTGVLVDTITSQQESLIYRVSSQGTVRPKLMTNLVSEVNGRITEVSPNFVEGGFFAAGELLVKVEQDDYLTAVKAAEANLARATAALEEERARVRVAEEEWASFTDGLAPELGLRRPQLARELANVRSAEAELERAVRDLSRTEIRAPYAGLLQSRAVNLGQFISRGTVLGNILGTDLAEIRLPLSDHDLAFMRLPGPDNPNYPAVELSAVVAGQLQQWQGKLVRTEGVLDERSRVIYAVVQVEDPYQLQRPGDSPLRFGRFVQANIEGIASGAVFRVPRNLLRPGNQLLLVDADNKLEFRTVQVQRTDERYAYISAGLSDGEHLAVSALPNPLAGMQVRLGRVNGEWQEVDSTSQTAQAGD
ncbi:efflux RND transporter periplasmic adaptor subunit [Alkalimonas delamerensis]|uniref:Efflux RND transporter periplasmic adaptor subunit n=1 Tax=Alkalimonas delamerensis TaxID=265981 RepID=A0ABT9GR13_9GAMM|nr:efflux RND transporter periplasmic adaptor subunit [Alkalimonas delamerensis]MDP4529413.1 efflux RND transporter periplasmic adaptor subunit [Alkalimonas delamerensis]